METHLNTTEGKKEKGIKVNRTERNATLKQVETEPNYNERKQNILESFTCSVYYVYEQNSVRSLNIDPLRCILCVLVAPLDIRTLDSVHVTAGQSSRSSPASRTK